MKLDDRSSVAITDQLLSIPESPDNEAFTRLQADPTSRNNEMQPGSVKYVSYYNPRSEATAYQARAT